VSVEIGCDVCGGEACAGSGKYAVCSEYCDMVAKEYTVRDEEISRLEGIIERMCHSDAVVITANEEKLGARIAHLEALIADAPHGKDCPKSQRNVFAPLLRCNCFKSRALDTKEKSNVHD